MKKITGITLATLSVLGIAGAIKYGKGLLKKENTWDKS